MEKPKIVVFTINYNQSKMTLECVETILKSDYENFKLLIIDNGSSEAEFQYLAKNLKGSSVDIERFEKNYGYVGGVNRGLKRALKEDPDYFLIMNNDTIIDREAIKYLVDAGERYDKNAIISGKVYHYDRPNVFQYVGGVYRDKRYLKMNSIHQDELDIGQCDVEMERDMLDDIFWLLPKKIFEDIGYYSDNFFLYAEQADYAIRVKNNRYKLIFTPKAKLWHKGSITTGNGKRFSPQVNFWRNKSSIIYLFRNTKRRYFYKNLISSFIKVLTKNVLNFFSSKDSDDKRSDYAALVGLIYGLKWIVKKQPDNGYNPFIK